MDSQIIKKIRQEYMNGMQVTSLAREYGVSKSYCSRIVRNLAYFDPAYDYTQKRKGQASKMNVLAFRSL